jgi:hypothetical protein
MSLLVTSCPSCRRELEITRLSCAGCRTQVEGHFELPALLRLPPADLAFVTAFVRSSGSLKAMAGLEKVSYPTVRNRLDDIIARLATLEQGTEREQHQILDELERGTIDAKEAALRLSRIQR